MADGDASPTRHAHRDRELSPTSSVDRISIEGDYSRMAEAVAAMLKPTIQETVAAAVQQGIEQLRRDLAAQTQSLKEMEERISGLEDDTSQSQGKVQMLENKLQNVLDKMDDLENRARRNNLRIIGLPETYKPSALTAICSELIPKALGINRSCIVERAHRLGAPYKEGSRARPIIVKFLNYSDKAHILQQFRESRALVIEGHKLLLFADYSIELSKKRKSFQKMCTMLHEKRVKFTLAYPATLKIQLENGNQHVFQDPSEAEIFVDSIHITNPPVTPSPKAQRTPGRAPKLKRQQESPIPPRRNNR